MSEATPVNKSQAQGYLPAGERPQCGNCWVRKTDDRRAKAGFIATDVCDHGKFPVAPDGWCPVWFPNDSWIRANKRVAAKLGISLGVDSTVSSQRKEL